MKQNDLLMVNLKNDPKTALMLFNVLAVATCAVCEMYECV